jgi:hypothetical protein
MAYVLRENLMGGDCGMSKEPISLVCSRRTHFLSEPWIQQPPNNPKYLLGSTNSVRSLASWVDAFGGTELFTYHNNVWSLFLGLTVSIPEAQTCGIQTSILHADWGRMGWFVVL